MAGFPSRFWARLGGLAAAGVALAALAWPLAQQVEPTRLAADAPWLAVVVGRRVRGADGAAPAAHRPGPGDGDRRRLGGHDGGAGPAARRPVPRGDGGRPRDRVVVAPAGRGDAAAHVGGRAQAGRQHGGEPHLGRQRVAGPHAGVRGRAGPAERGLRRRGRRPWRRASRCSAWPCWWRTGRWPSSGPTSGRCWRPRRRGWCWWWAGWSPPWPPAPPRPPRGWPPRWWCWCSSGATRSGCTTSSSSSAPCSRVARDLPTRPDRASIERLLLDRARTFTHAGSATFEDRPPSGDSFGVPLEEGGTTRWLVVHDRSHGGETFRPAERETLRGVATLGAAGAAQRGPGRGPAPRCDPRPAHRAAVPARPAGPVGAGRRPRRPPRPLAGGRVRRPRRVQAGQRPAGPRGR